MIEDSTRSIQDAYFDADFASQDDAFTQFYERLNIKRRLREIKQFITQGQALEVGVGRGNLLCALQGAGYEASGIDLSNAVCTAIQARYGLSVHCNSLEAYAETMPAGAYDLIIMCHVLEHVGSLPLTLQAISHLLKQEGVLFIAVPNLFCWNARLPGWTGYEPYHLHYFSPGTLRQLLESAGFEVIYERTFEPLSGWFNAITKSLLYHSPDLEVSVSEPQVNNYHKGLRWGLYNVMRISIGSLLSPLRWLQSALGYGEELVMIARPNGSSSMG